MAATFSDSDYEKDYEDKVNGLEKLLGPVEKTVGHAIIPFEVGGAVDMYYFSNHIRGTGFATMELLQPDGTGPCPNTDGTYEFVAFTKHSYSTSEDENLAFNKIERRICGIFTRTGFYSFDAKLKSGDTCEVPVSNTETRCILLDKYPKNQDLMVGNRKHHLFALFGGIPTGNGLC